MKPIDALNLSDDFLFSKVMENNEICRRILETILDISIREVRPVVQKEINISPDFSHGVRFDVYVNDDQNTVYDVEMQQGRRYIKVLPWRSRYYLSISDVNDLAKGMDYTQLRRSIIIFICTDDPFDKGRHIYHFHTICDECPELRLEDGTEKIFLNASGTADDVSADLLAFLNYVKDSTEANAGASELTQEIHEEVLRVRENPRTRGDIMTLYEHYQEEREEGREEGMRSGLEKGRSEIIRSLLKSGMPPEKIAEICGLPVEMIRKIAGETEA